MGGPGRSPPVARPCAPPASPSSRKDAKGRFLRIILRWRTSRGWGRPRSRRRPRRSPSLAAYAGAPLVALSRDAAPDASAALRVRRGDRGHRRARPGDHPRLRAGRRRCARAVGGAARRRARFRCSLPASDQFARRLAKVAKASRQVGAPRGRDLLPRLRCRPARLRRRHRALRGVRDPRPLAPGLPSTPRRAGWTRSSPRRRLLDVLTIAPRVLGVAPEDVSVRVRTARPRRLAVRRRGAPVRARAAAGPFFSPAGPCGAPGGLASCGRGRALPLRSTLTRATTAASSSTTGRRARASAR